MEILIEFIDQLNYFNIIDLGFVFFFILVLILFFAKKRNFLVALIYIFAIFVHLGVLFCYTYLFDGQALFIALNVCRFVDIFLIVNFCVVYQNDLKTIFAKIGRSKIDDNYVGKNNNEDELVKASSEIVKACQHMSKNDTGALILICPNSVPENIIATGTRLDCLLNSQILESIFINKAPLHDGAVVIKGGYIVAAGCFLPLSENPNLDKNLGTRHRAAVGITEQCDVVSIVVSEETGIISVVKKGMIKRYITSEKLTDILADAYGITSISSSEKRRR